MTFINEPGKAIPKTLCHIHRRFRLEVNVLNKYKNVIFVIVYNRVKQKNEDLYN